MTITGQDFFDYEEMYEMMAIALKKCYEKQTHFRKKISVEEAESSKGQPKER